MSTLDDEIARKLQEAAAAGELRLAKSWGRPMAAWAGWDETPAELRMPYKILKDAGYAPPEIGLFQLRAALRKRLEGTSDDGLAALLRGQLLELEQRIALRLEGLRISGNL